MIKGIYPPIPTPFKNEEVAYDKLKENILKWNQTGLSGLVIAGSNGESVFLTREEKLKIVEAAKESIAAERKIIVGTGSDSIRETISLTNDAGRAGADAALILTPCYYKPKMNHTAFVRYYNDVAEAAKIPILIYDVPKFSGVHIESDTVIELSEHPNIVGIKCSSGNVAEIFSISNGVSESFSTLVGTASVLQEGLQAGASGGILALANIAPDECVQIYNQVQSNKIEEAQSIQKRMIEPNKAVTAVYGIPGLKAAMDKIGYYGGPVRSPLSDLSDEELPALLNILRNANIELIAGSL
ncbi:MAG: dihydrodipicolinate synthase family protein [Planctomycetes bacterium]|nr:dihydrodipicolinate synthase family protein [Planctomycetota bacterium]